MFSVLLYLTFVVDKGSKILFSGQNRLFVSVCLSVTQLQPIKLPINSRFDMTGTLLKICYFTFFQNDDLHLFQSGGS